MREELRYRRDTLMPELIEEVKRTRAFGDLSENFEYKEAKRQKNRNGSRIRYLENMIRSAHVIDSGSKDKDTVGLFDKVTVYIPDDDEEQVISIVTTIRTDPLKGLMSRESPFGKAVFGKKVGDTVTVEVNERVSYKVEIRKIEKCEDDGSAPILQY